MAPFSPMLTTISSKGALYFCKDPRISSVRCPGELNAPEAQSHGWKPEG